LILNGLECLAAIKRMPRLEGVPVVLHSWNMTEECRARGMALGASGCMAKPDTLVGLADLLGRMMGVEVG
jgi:CheY-like chemotaxis protein